MLDKWTRVITMTMASYFQGKEYSKSSLIKSGLRGRASPWGTLPDSLLCIAPGADEYKHATPILSLCHGIFTDRSIFSTNFLL